MQYREDLERELGKLREERREIEHDIQRLNARLVPVREHKVKVENVLMNLKMVEDELEQMDEEANRLDIEIKVIC